MSKVVGVILQPLTILLTVALLVLVIIDLYTYAWNTQDDGYINPNEKLSWCTPWSFYKCSGLWNVMGIRHKIALILHLCLIPFTIIMILVSSLAVFTRVMRKQTTILILIFISWLTYFVLLATVVLRMMSIANKNCSIISPNFGFYYHDHWQIYITLSSLIVAFLVTQVFAFGGYFRPMITMLSFEGHYQRYDYPRISKLEQNMVSVKEVDNF